MAIRISGINSGLDTESLVKELVSAYSLKKENYDKQLTKQEWIMKKWGDVNSKVYDFTHLHCHPSDIQADIM